MGKTEAFQSLCERMNKGFQSLGVSCKATYQGRAIQVLDSTSLSQAVIRGVFEQAVNVEFCPYEIQKNSNSNWKITFTSLGDSIICMKHDIVQATLKAVGDYLNRHEDIGGIWYPDDYSKYLFDHYDIEMPEKMNCGHADDRYFERRKPFTFVVKEGVRASQALLAFLQGPTVADCGNANMACWYKALLDVMGESRFDQIFGSGPFALRIDQWGVNHKNSSIGLLSVSYGELKEEGEIGRRPLNISDECYFGGVVFYSNKHPRGASSGYNVIYAGDNAGGEQLFIGHGLSEPMTERELMRLMILNYNEERTPQDLRYIQEANQPHLLDRNVNPLLMHGYTLSADLIVKDPRNLMGGFLAATRRSLDAKAVFLIMATNNPIKQMLELQRVRV